MQHFAGWLFAVLVQLFACCSPTKSVTADTTAEGGLRLSEYRGTLQRFFEQAQRTGQVAIIDKSVTISQPILIKGDIKIAGENDPVLTNRVIEPKTSNAMFHLFEGRHLFEGFTVQQHARGTAFFTEQQPRIVWHNEFDKVHVLTGANAYASSRGGLWDAAKDSVMAWSGTVWKNSKLRGGTVQISIYSQDGPAKYLHLENMDIANGREFGDTRVQGRPEGEVTHTLYCHPNVSLRFYNVTLSAGKLGLHFYSGGGVPGQNRYVEFRKLYSIKNGIEMQNPRTGYVVIDSSDMGTYRTSGQPTPRVWATNSNFRNTGNGIFLSGQVENCTGGIWTPGAGEQVIIRNSNLNELNFRGGGKAIVHQSTIAYVYAGDRDNTFDGEFNNSTISQVQIAKPLGKLKMKNSKITGTARGAEGVIIRQ